mmetsp:Transcript_22701/g.62674  ORF Transcript_22701/g.62674 Transcript_22701/m.62674 type:complete len:110 (-) Transcript_22701:681-1010(-)
MRAQSSTSSHIQLFRQRSKKNKLNSSLTRSSHSSSKIISSSSSISHLLACKPPRRRVAPLQQLPWLHPHHSHRARTQRSHLNLHSMQGLEGQVQWICPSIDTDTINLGP